jgi:hypothetical protein
MVKQDDREKSDWNDGLSVSTLLHSSTFHALAHCNLIWSIQLRRLSTDYPKDTRIFSKVQLQKSWRPQGRAIPTCLQYDR